ncbi:MAG: preprotein translocase subunit Sec61beta [Thermoplasmatota archaeon]
MAKKDKGPGIQSAAGLIRYFDAEEETSFKISPAAVLIFSGLVGVAVVLLKMFWHYA